MQNVVLWTALIASATACGASPAPPAADSTGSADASQPAAAPDASGGPAAGSGATGAPTTEPGRASGQPGTPVSTIAAVDSREDAHWVQADDYFVAHHAYESGWVNVSLAKMKEAPKPGGDGQALFFFIRDGREGRSAHFYRTRPAVKADLVLGNLLICFDDNKKGKLYQAPRDKDNARPGGWWLARITDLSDLGKGYATLSGSYHCVPDALRAIVQ